MNPLATLPPDLPFAVELEPRWLLLSSPVPLRMLSWAIQRGGPVEARRVAWHTVGDADLPVLADPAAVFAERLAARGWSDAVGLLTARAVESFRVGEACVGGVRAVSVFTVDLGNAARIGMPDGCRAGWRPGTINSFTWLSAPLTEVALVEALAMVVEARTLTLLENGPGGVTGTGTDCAIVACPVDGPAQRYAGLHTPLAHAIGGSVAAAMGAALAAWQAERR